MNTLNSKVTRGFHPRVRGFKVSVDIDKPNQKNFYNPFCTVGLKQPKHRLANVSCIKTFTQGCCYISHPLSFAWMQDSLAPSENNTIPMAS